MIMITNDCSNDKWLFYVIWYLMISRFFHSVFSMLFMAIFDVFALGSQLGSSEVIWHGSVWTNKCQIHVSFRKKHGYKFDTCSSCFPLKYHFTYHFLGGTKTITYPEAVSELIVWGCGLRFFGIALHFSSPWGWRRPHFCQHSGAQTPVVLGDPGTGSMELASKGEPKGAALSDEKDFEYGHVGDLCQKWRGFWYGIAKTRFAVWLILFSTDPFLF